MSTHDAYARITPYELALPDREFAAERFARIREEGEEERGEPLRDPGHFLSLVSVSETLAEIRPRGEDPEVIHQYGVLLYHAFHFREAGKPLYLLTTHGARYLVESGGGTGARDGQAGEKGRAEPDPGAVSGGPRPPEPAGYLQLPRYLFWTRPVEDDPPEPVDGLFWSAPGGERLSALVACGVRGDRPGLSVVPLPPVPLADAPEWLDARGRPGGEDFASTLPGGELERLYSLETAGEVLKLAARFFRYVAAFPDAVEERSPPQPERGEERPPPEPGRGGPGEPDGEGGPGGAAGPEPPRPSGLPYRRVGLGEAAPAAGSPGPDERATDETDR